MSVNAQVYPTPNGFHVSIELLGEEVDDAGPFDDLDDAVQMAMRATEGGGSVNIANSIRTTDDVERRLGSLALP